MFGYDYGQMLEAIDYESMGLSDTWYYRDTLLMFISYEMEINKHYNKPNAKRTYSVLFDRYNSYLENIIYNKLIEYDDGLTKEERQSDQNNNSVSYDTDMANFNKHILLDYVVNNNTIKLDIDRLNAFLNGDELPDVKIVVNKKVPCPVQETIPDNYVDNDKYHDNSLNDVESFKYLNIRGLKLEDVTDKLFYDIKRSYGMLQKEESKYRRAVSVAAKIGLLFYERSLGKPSTRPAFLKAYKHEFDSILKDDKLAKEIYSYLPEEYRGVAKPQDSSVDLLPIIKAAVFAGYLEGTQEDVTGSELISALRDESYVIPDETTLLKILEAMNNLK